MNDGDDTKSPTGTAQRVLNMLVFLADSDGPVSVRHAADKLGLAPSTVHRLLNLLVDGGFATHDPQTSTYSVGPQFYRVAARITAQVSPSTIALRAIGKIAQRYDETILFALYMARERRISFAARADGQKRLLYRIEMNTPLSMVWGASGKAALAYLPEEDIVKILYEEGASPATGQSTPDRETLLAELAQIRQQGFAVSHGEKLPDALGIAAPVFGPQGILGTVCMTMPRDRAPDVAPAELGQEIAVAAKELTLQLGGRMP
ncbi:IclR family transcriptional regulator [Oceaniglobus trochenteri]|uniref:IclR family transcriptional regulator n=1 Tax=Oceaniglobus trochenteri TaxID=2763260 RepID=UPI001CFF9B29|nr:IclR family transcriptional regulator [Oceaniglobus trochenteri]